MPKNKSEKTTIRLSKNSFLNMYVFNNPNKKYIQTGESDEFCDCLIHMLDWDIVIQVKENKDPDAKKWFQRQILGEARKQLTISCVALSLKEFEIWDRENSICLSNTPKNPQQVFPVIVFEKEDLHKYQQVALSEKRTETCFGYVACNIFSMEDFEYVTSMIPTGKDFVEYLIFRFNKLKQLEPCIQLYPIFKKGDQFLLAKNVSTNEQILISEFLHSKFENPEEVLINAKMWHDNLSGLEVDNVNNDFLQILSYLSMEEIKKWDDHYKDLKRTSNNIHYVWKSEPVLIGTIDNRKYGIMLSYAPMNTLISKQTSGDKEIENDALALLNKYELSAMFVFQYTDSKTVRLVTITKH